MKKMGEYIKKEDIIGGTKMKNLAIVIGIDKYKKIIMI